MEKEVTAKTNYMKARHIESYQSKKDSMIAKVEIEISVLVYEDQVEDLVSAIKEEARGLSRPCESMWNDHPMTRRQGEVLTLMLDGYRPSFERKAARVRLCKGFAIAGYTTRKTIFDLRKRGWLDTSNKPTARARAWAGREVRVPGEGEWELDLL